MGFAATFELFVAVDLAALVGVGFVAGRIGRAVFAVDLPTDVGAFAEALAAGLAALFAGAAFAAFAVDAGLLTAFGAGLLTAFAVPDFLPAGFWTVGCVRAGLAAAGLDFSAADVEAARDSIRDVARRSDVLAALEPTRPTDWPILSDTTGMSTPLIRRNACSGRHAPAGAKIARKGGKNTGIRSVAASDHADPRRNRAAFHRAFPDFVGE